MTSTNNIEIENALNASWPVAITRDGHRRIAPGRTAIAVKVQGKVGNLVSVTDDGWAEIQLAGETRKDEWPLGQVALATLEEVDLAYGADRR